MDLTVFKYALLRGIRSPMSIVVNFGLPLFLIFPVDIWDGDAVFQNGFTLMATVILFGSFLVARGIMNDRQDGTVTRILAGPTTTFRYLSQNLLACMVPLAGSIIVVMSIGYFQCHLLLYSKFF